MLKKFYREVIVPTGLMSALIMGAGLFSLPYLFSVAGVSLGFAYLAVFAIVFTMIHLMYSEVIRQSPGDHRFVGYARMHLGQPGFWLSILTTQVGILLVLLIYLVLSVHFVKAVFPAAPETYVFLAVWAVFSLSVISGIERLAKLDVLITGLKLLIIIGIFTLGAGGFRGADFPLNPGHLFLPYGAILFSLSGRSAISSIHQYLREKRISERYLKLSLGLGTFLPAALYALFVIGVLGISGHSVTEDSVSGIAVALPWAGIIIFALGLLSLWTAYTFLGFEARSILIKDFKLSRYLSAGVMITIPPILYFLGLNNFLSLIAISGGVLLSIESILVILMWNKAVRPKAAVRFSSYLLAGVFVLAGMVEIWLTVKS